MITSLCGGKKGLGPKASGVVHSSKGGQRHDEQPPLTLAPPVPWQSMYQSYGSPSQYGMASSYGSATAQQPSAPQHQGTLNQVMLCLAAPGQLGESLGLERT
jgi:hypothetical protein